MEFKSFVTTARRRYLGRLVYEKNRWARPLSEEERAAGFRGWHERGYLPHCDYPGLIQFVTFRLDDSLPASRRGEWEHLLSIENVREKRTKLEEYLDRGVGDCHLRDPRIANCCEGAMLFFNRQRYDLRAWCVMPNHVHVLVEVWDRPLWKIVQSWRHWVQRQANVLLSERRLPARRGRQRESQTPCWKPAPRAFWQRDYWDTFMRDVDQERRAVRYIEANPGKAGLCRTAKEWPFSSARFRDDYQRLRLPDRAD